MPLYPGGGGVGSSIALGAGSASAPAITAGGATNSGFFFRNTGAAVDWSVGGTTQFQIDNAATTLRSAASLAWSSSTPDVAGGDLFLTRDAANTLGLRNGANAQTLNLYNSYTDAANNEFTALRYVGNTFQLVSGSAGTGTARNIQIGVNGAGLAISGAATTFNLNQLFGTDNTFDIGASGANRPRTIYSGSNIIAGTGVLIGNYTLQLGPAGSSRGTLSSPTTDGVFKIADSTGTDFGRLQFGGTTSSFPALKKSGTQLQARLADDSGDASLSASYVKTPALTVATLPAAATAGAGARSFVTDATATTFLSTVAGGGANKVPVTSDGTNWLIG